MSSLRQLPSVDEVARRIRGYPHRVVVNEVRRVLEEARHRLRMGLEESIDIEAEVRAALAEWGTPSLRAVINATGVVLHTNLGRAPLASFAPHAAYSNLEYDLETGSRGKRDVHIGPLLERLTGAAGIAVNNNAAAVYLVLNELAAGAEVIVSRGQLIEIGDGFRIPDIMQRAGVTLREVGTTNRTRLSDYRDAITDRTKLLLIVHPSNFRIEGFTGQPAREEIVRLGRENRVPVYEDLGSGCLVDLAPYGIREPLVQDCIRDGVDLVSFSGDKLLGGPQAGLIVGHKDLVTRVRRNPMFRALRLDKLILQSLETTLRHVVLENWDALPAIAMIRADAATIRQRAEAMSHRIPGSRVVPGHSVIGGGSTPEQTLPTWLVALPAKSTMTVERRLRLGDPAVIARIEDDEVVLDLRTVLAEQEAVLVAAVQAALAEGREEPDPE
jgi:L-seryl-tRNA(Ser) seleniumtransferase